MLIGKNLVVKPDFPFSELASGQDHTLCNSSTIEPGKGQRISGQKGRLDAERPVAVPDVDEGRTRTLKSALDKIWKKLDPHSHIFQRFPFDQNAPMVPKRNRGEVVGLVQSRVKIVTTHYQINGSYNKTHPFAGCGKSCNLHNTCLFESGVVTFPNRPLDPRSRCLISVGGNSYPCSARRRDAFAQTTKITTKKPLS